MLDWPENEFGIFFGELEVSEATRRSEVEVWVAILAATTLATS